MLDYDTHSTSHLLSRAYRPVADEVTVSSPAITGTLPSELDGSFLRIGPNSLSARRGGHDPAVEHTFAGDAMVHAVRLGGGRAHWYRNRWVRTDRVAAELGELPTPGPRYGLGDNANAGLVQHAGNVLALGDAGVLPHRLGPQLQTVDRFDFGGTLPDGFGARPVQDPLTGELHAVAYYHELNHVTYVTVDALGKVRRAEPIAVKGTPMMHALSLTDRHTVLYDLPVTYSAADAAAGSRVPYRWDDSHGARLGVLPRDGGDADVLWMDIDPCYVFHPVNAYERGREIVVDVIRHERAFDRDPLHPVESEPAMWRWTIDRVGGTVSERRLFEGAEEFPCIDERMTGTRHRWSWSVGMAPGLAGALGGRELLRHDLTAMRTDVHDLGPGREGGAPVFVPRGPSAPEGDGWVLTMVYDHATDRSDLVVVDTADFTGDPVAVVHLPVRAPHGLASLWTAGR
ncbi:carotenoid oxygenase family protein [Actinacidiphila sp. DG2A-62]|uniref:carotenoid oxygenase family protein n=1 Tax=Actinacidiphila sp. DG2A-62 TaxID=3108821 RepID=UPI002DBB69CD|nr:carotenoid oxygenase family protein [Actinacidiphila sp. DG2A-62]MEC3993159.1 carotenoid oxygenase family protein [Actinacidiphila sp. DG2A-62]